MVRCDTLYDFQQMQIGAQNANLNWSLAQQNQQAMIISDYNSYLNQSNAQYRPPARQPAVWEAGWWDNSADWDAIP